MARDDEFREFVHSHGRLLRRIGYLVCGSWDRAEDLTQDTFARLYGAWGRLTYDDDRLAYARRILVNRSIDASRRSWNREHPSEDLPSVSVAAPDPTTAIALRRALQTLPPRRRACLVLRYFDDLPVAEVAVILGISEGTVKSHTARGLDDLRAALHAAGLTHELLEGAHP